VIRTGRLTPFLYVAPMAALLLFVFVWPLASVVEFSFKRIRGSDGPFIGLENYRSVLNDDLFRAALSHNVELLVAVPLLIVGAILVAAVLYDRPRGWRLYRTILFLPYVLSIPIVGTVFGNILQLNGALNETLRAASLGGAAADWLGDPGLTLPVLMLVIVWREIGFGIVLFVAGMAGLREELAEAAEIDGAGWWSRLWYVTIPQLRSVIEFYAVICIITMLTAVFSYVYVVTRGGPGNATQVLELYIFNYGFKQSLPGIASAVAVILFVVTVALMVPLLRLRAQASMGDIE